MVNGFKSTLIEYIKNELKEDKLDQFIVKLIQRRIDNYLKNINLSSGKSSNDMKELLVSEISALAKCNIDMWILKIRNKIQGCIEQQDLDELLTIYENKGLLAKSASILKGVRKDEFENWIIRVLNNKDNNLINVIKNKLPVLN